MNGSRLDELFDAAQAIALEQRPAWLDSVCADDPVLRHKLERLLAADARAEGVLEVGAEIIGEVMGGAAAPPQAFGVWRVVGALGHGGMGEVWLAERDDAGFLQRAAVKQVAFPTPGLLQRFHAERQILARLQHPGIARLIDGGVDADGCPYLVMEHVEGVGIDRWVAERTLGVRATVALLLEVCETVQYAHRNLVVHSDIKPSNILVGEDGKPRLLDFGIAKVLGEEGDGASRTATRLLTPDYAAPEWLAGASPTIQVDVYALGVLAYELLAGHKPYRVGGRGEALARQLVDTPTRPPSAAVAAERADAGSRRRHLKGDLDRVVMTAMAPEPARRYGTVAELAADLRAWMDGRAVAARGDGALYRLRKFVARNRVATAIAAVAVLALVAATAFSLQQARVARQQATQAQTITRFLTDMFRFADPRGVPGGLQLSARQMLDAGAQRYDRELRDQPALAARFSIILASIYSELGKYDRAIALAADALKLREVSPAQRAKALAVLARARYEKGEYPAAQANIDQAMALHVAVDGRGSASVAADIALAGEIARRQGDFKRAETLTQRALAMSRAALAAPDAQIATELGQLATLYGDMHRPKDARAPIEEALAMFRELYGENHLDVAESLANLATVDMQTGHLQQALPLFAKVEGIYRRLLPGAHPLLAVTLASHARALDRAGHYRDSLAKYQQALAMQRQLLGNDHPDIATTLNNLAVLEYQMGDFKAASQHWREVVALWSRLGKPNHPFAQISRIYVAVAARGLGDSPQAERMLRASREQARKSFGDAHPISLLAGVQLAVTLGREGKTAEALAVHGQVATAMQTHPRLPALFKAKASMQYALGELQAGDIKAAQTRIEQTGQMMDAIGKTRKIDAVTRGQMLLIQARIASAAGESDKACKAATQATALQRRTFGNQSAPAARARKAAAELDCGT